MKTKTKTKSNSTLELSGIDILKMFVKSTPRKSRSSIQRMHLGVVSAVSEYVARVDDAQIQQYNTRKCIYIPNSFSRLDMYIVFAPGAAADYADTRARILKITAFIEFTVILVEPRDADLTTFYHTVKYKSRIPLHITHKEVDM